MDEDNEGREAKRGTEEDVKRITHLRATPLGPFFFKRKNIKTQLQ